MTLAFHRWQMGVRQLTTPDRTVSELRSTIPPATRTAVPWTWNRISGTGKVTARANTENVTRLT